MGVEEFSNAGFVRKMQQSNLEAGLGEVWEQSRQQRKCC